jgi:hypothetical protein
MQVTIDYHTSRHAVEARNNEAQTCMKPKQLRGQIDINGFKDLHGEGWEAKSKDIRSRLISMSFLFRLSKASWGSINIIIRPMPSYLDMKHKLRKHYSTVGTFSIHKTRYVLIAILYFYHFMELGLPIHQGGSMHNAGESESALVCISRLPGGRRKQVALRRRLPNHPKHTQILSSIIFHPLPNMKTTDEYKVAVANAIAFKHEHPDEKATTAARIHHVNATTLRSNLRREQIPDKEVKAWGPQ